MANVRLGAKAVGSTVKIKVNGTVKDLSLSIRQAVQRL